MGYFIKTALSENHGRTYEALNSLSNVPLVYDVGCITLAYLRIRAMNAHLKPNGGLEKKLD